MRSLSVAGNEADLVDAFRRCRVLYTDLDGTLLGQGGCLLVDGQGQPSSRAANAVVALNRLGSGELAVIPTTGRSVTQLVEITRMCGWRDFIAEAGAIRSYWNEVRACRKNLYDTPLWSDELTADGRTPLEVINDSGAFELLRDAFPGQLESHDPWNVNRLATNVLRGRLDYRRAQQMLDRLALPITLVENGAINPPVHSLAPDSDGQPIHAYHLVPAGTSKRTAIEADLARRGLETADALMIGDGLADLQCAPAVAFVFMVRNALDAQGLGEQIAATDNAVVTGQARGDGWAELASAILAAKKGGQ